MTVLSRRIAYLVTVACFGGIVAFAASEVSKTVDRGDFSPFIRSLDIKPYGYTLTNDPTGQAPTTQVERFEVRSGDCYFNGGWRDCKKDCERPELWEQGERRPRDTTAWYGWSLYVHYDWPNVFPTKTVLGQFHQHRAHPLWMFYNFDGELMLDERSIGCSKRAMPLIPASDFAGKWHHL